MTENTKNPSDLDKGNENQTGDNDAISSMHVFVAEAIRLTRQKSDLAAAALFLSYFLNTTDESILIQYGLDPDALRIVGNRFRENEVWCEEYEEPVLFSFVEDELTSIIDVGRGILILDRFFIPVDSNDSYVFTSVESAKKYYAREFFQTFQLI